MSTDTTARNRGDSRAPAPDDPAKTDSPDDLEERSWRYILRKTAREFSSDQCTDIGPGHARGCGISSAARAVRCRRRTPLRCHVKPVTGRQRRV